LKGCACHLCDRLPTHFGDHSLGRAFFDEIGKQEQHPSWSLFAGIEELVNEILFVSDVSVPADTLRTPLQLFQNDNHPKDVHFGSELLRTTAGSAEICRLPNVLE
jgi:hypothetical protein